MVGRRLHPIMPFGMFLCPLWKMQGFTSCKNKPTFFGHLLFSFFISFFISFLSVGRHCFVNWSHFGRCCHCQPHSNRLGITGGFFSWGDCDSGNLGEGTTLYDGYSMDFFSSHHRSFWVSSQTIRHFFSSMSLHDMDNKGHWKPSFIDVTFFW
jgi:hypothetical protein